MSKLTKNEFCKLISAVCNPEIRIVSMGNDGWVKPYAVEILLNYDSCIDENIVTGLVHSNKISNSNKYANCLVLCAYYGGFVGQSEVESYKFRHRVNNTADKFNEWIKESTK